MSGSKKWTKVFECLRPLATAHKNLSFHAITSALANAIFFG